MRTKPLDDFDLFSIGAIAIPDSNNGDTVATVYANQLPYSKKSIIAFPHNHTTYTVSIETAHKILSYAEQMSMLSVSQRKYTQVGTGQGSRVYWKFHALNFINDCGLLLQEADRDALEKARRAKFAPLFKQSIPSYQLPRRRSGRSTLR